MNSKLLCSLSLMFATSACSLDNPEIPAKAEEQAPQASPAPAQPEPIRFVNLDASEQVTAETESRPAPQKTSIIQDLQNGKFDSVQAVGDFPKPENLTALQQKFWFAGLQARTLGERQFFADLIENTDLWFQVDDEGRTILHHLAELGRTRLLKLIFTHELSLFDVRDNWGRYPVHYSGNKETAEFLFLNTRVYTADRQHKLLDPAINLRDDQGKLPLHTVIERKHSAAGTFLVERLCRGGLSAILYGSGINATDHIGRSAIHFAAIADDLATTDQLLRCVYTDEKARDHLGRTALHYASEHPDFAVGYALICGMQSLSEEFRGPDKNGDKAVDIARKNRGEAGVAILTRLRN